MLVIRRKAADVITIEPIAGMDTSISVEELFSSGLIEITLLHITRKSVKISVSAPPQLKIWRGKPEGPDSTNGNFKVLSDDLDLIG